MKSLITCFLLFLLSYNTFAAELKDSTRSKDKSTTSRERERKAGSESGSSGSYNEEDESCFSSCLIGFAGDLFSSSGSDEPTRSPYRTDSTSLKPVNHPQVRNYLKAAFDAQGLTGNGPEGTIEEYQDPAIGYRLANMLYYKGFVLNLAFAQGFQNGEPLYDYTTTKVEGENETVIKDVPYSTYVSNTSLLLGVGYMLDLSTEVGVRFGSGAVYQTFKEETELKRETFVNESSLGTTNVTENLKFSGLNPYVSLDLYYYVEQNASIMLDIGFQYNFINRDPGYLKSTPLDWNSLEGQYTVSLGISFNVL